MKQTAIKKMVVKNRVYLDYAAATPVDERVQKVFNAVSREHFANPDGLSAQSVAAKKVLEDSRKEIAKTLHCLPDEVFFTSGATEANNLAIQGFFSKQTETRPLTELHAIVSSIEHSSVIEPLQALAHRGLLLTIVPVNSLGIVSLIDFKKALQPNTVFVAVMAANNEIGTIQPLDEIAKMMRGYSKRLQKEKKPHSGEPVLFSDMGQLPLYKEIDLRKFSVDMLSIDGQKIYGPRSSGVLIKRRRLELNSILFGGGQEGGLRSGTPHVAAAAAFAKALVLAADDVQKETTRLASLRNYFIEQLQKKINVPFSINGSVEERLPNNLNISFENVDGEFLAIALDSLGVSCSTKSACLESTSGQKIDGLEGSQIVWEVTHDRQKSRGALRFTFGRATTKKVINATVSALKTALTFAA